MITSLYLFEKERKRERPIPVAVSVRRLGGARDAGCGVAQVVFQLRY